ncbi:cation diffusion facilitator family transporter [Pilibacter termitis]|uniref:Cation diffusion facilitator family transporter n=1 Tax=Pilibacter termitis TaxID=263852 RepID=A0A1T4QT96_9ENTE|nr:cation diffusion facilitator family transporter [Pilibacter termitis]SKA06711.1 cation diffusion facilitator family transporter [Pilibacter termitis]
MENKRYKELQAAEKGAIISISAYLLLTAGKIVIGNWGHSNALTADGLNNFTDILASCAVLIGLRIARRPADKDHAYGHWKIETVASMVTSFIMLMVGLEVFVTAVEKIVNKTYEKPDPLAACVGIFSAIIMLGVYKYNAKLAKEVNSHALLAAAKDNLSDAFTSIGTSLAIVVSLLPNAQLFDILTSIVIAFLILKTALEIFKESAFSLSDGFDEELLETYETFLLEINGVERVRAIRGRQYGANIFLDVVVEMDPTLTVLQSHYITEIIEERLQKELGVFDTDVHVEPFLNYTQEKEQRI